MNRRALEAGLAARLRAAMSATDRPQEALFALEEFLPEATLSVREDVDTARIVRARERYRIEFGRDFLDRELVAPKDLAFVFLHEVYHHVLGHLAALPPQFREPAWRPIVNLAADMMVNRAVLQRYFAGAVPLLERLYRPDRFPECLLLPPAAYGLSRGVIGPDTRAGRRSLRRMDRALAEGLDRAGLPRPIQQAAGRVYRAAWFEEVPFDRLLGLVADLLRQGLVLVMAWPQFLGNHDPDAAPCDGLPWSERSDPTGESSEGARLDDLEERDLDEEIEPALSPVLAQAIRMALVDDPNHPRRRFGAVQQPGVLFAPGRSDWLSLARGLWPAMFHGTTFGVTEEDQRAHLYVDVSGSVDAWIGRIYGLVLALGDEVGSAVHLFSNEVLDRSLDDLARGRVTTTGGTDFDCVIRHALAHGYRRIVVVTDGIGDLEPANADAFRASGASLYLVLIRFGAGRVHDFSPLYALARNVWELD